MLSNYHVALALALALAMIIAIVFIAPTMAAGLDRLKLVMNTVGLFIVVALASGGAVMLAWGLWAGEKELVYLSFLPLVGSSLFYGLVTRRHQTWYGALGFDDSSARWKSFWNETTDLWQLHRGARSDDDTRSASRRRSGFRQGATARRSGARTFSFSFSGSGPAAMEALLASAAHQLVTDDVSVFPSELNVSIVLPPDGDHDRAYLQAFEHTLAVRKNDGGPLTLSALTDIPFLDVAIGPRDVDGSYPVTVKIAPKRLVPGPFSGAVLIRTGDPLQRLLTVPVDGVVEHAGPKLAHRC